MQRAIQGGARCAIWTCAGAATAAGAFALLDAWHLWRGLRRQRRRDGDKGVLGKVCAAPEAYSPGVLFPIPRLRGRKLLGIDGPLPFEGEDVWRASGAESSAGVERQRP